MSDSTVFWFDHALKVSLNGSVNLQTDTLKAILVNGYTFDGDHTEYADVIAFELVTGNGYIAGGQTLANKTIEYDSTDTVVDADDTGWTATPASIGPATGAIIYSDTSTGDMVLCYIDFGGSKTAQIDSTFLLAYAAGGILDINKS